MLLQYGLPKDKQIMGCNYPMLDFLFYELFFTLIALRVGRLVLKEGKKSYKKGRKRVCSLSSEADVRLNT